VRRRITRMMEDEAHRLDAYKSRPHSHGASFAQYILQRVLEGQESFWNRIQRITDPRFRVDVMILVSCTHRSVRDSGMTSKNADTPSRWPHKRRQQLRLKRLPFAFEFQEKPP